MVGLVHPNGGSIHHAATSACANCGVVAVSAGGVCHPYMVSSAGCWASFGELQADEMTRFGYPSVHGLVVDAYASAHGGDGSQRRDRQSVCIHLMALCASLERDETPARRVELLRQLTSPKTDWPCLTRPPGAPALNHSHAAGATDLDDYVARVTAWGRAVWSFWEPEHRRLRQMLDGHL
jgi:hypothetical protein